MVMRVLRRPGVWKHAGMSGALSGLDLAEALVSLPEECDREFARRLLIAGEAGFLTGDIERTKDAK